jgi:hypothetical protein
VVRGIAGEQLDDRAEIAAADNVTASEVMREALRRFLEAS